ncbi:MAG: hypothetical protein ABJJ69_00265 [Paracoccaceae bacterium]
MRDYTATPSNPTILACHMLTKEASTPIPNNSFGDDLAKVFDPTQPAQQEFDDYSLSRTVTHIKISVASKSAAEIPLAWVPRIINDLTTGV